MGDFSWTDPFSLIEDCGFMKNKAHRCMYPLILFYTLCRERGREAGWEEERETEREKEHELNIVLSKQVLYGSLLVAHSLGSRGNTPDGEGGPQWRGRQPWGHHLLQSLPCTGQNHCHTRGRWSLLHTWWMWLSELGPGAPLDGKRRE